MKRAIIAAAMTAAVVTAAARPALAEWPADRPIHIIVGFGAGGGTDIVARIMAQKMSEILGQSIVVENRTGASGLIAADTVWAGLVISAV